MLSGDQGDVSEAVPPDEPHREEECDPSSPWLHWVRTLSVTTSPPHQFKFNRFPEHVLWMRKLTRLVRN